MLNTILGANLKINALRNIGVLICYYIKRQERSECLVQQGHGSPKIVWAAPGKRGSGAQEGSLSLFPFLSYSSLPPSSLLPPFLSPVLLFFFFLSDF